MSKSFKKILEYTFYPFIIVASLILSYKISIFLSIEYMPIIPGIVSTLVMFLVLAAERFLPYKKEWNKNHGDLLSDFSRTFMVLPLATSVIQYVLMKSVDFAEMYFEFSHSTILSNQNIIIQLLIITLATEFTFYWSHRLAHTNFFLWRLHSVHHSARRLYFLNSGTFNLFDIFINFLCYLFPLFFLRPSGEVFTLFFTLSATTGILEHANIKMKTNFLAPYFNIPDLHRIHHSIDDREGKSNFGKITCFWDFVFKTYYFPEEAVKEIGIKEPVEKTKGLINQILLPFKINKS